MIYIGTMPTRLINDRQIRPTEYRRWADARPWFERREKHGGVLQNLLETIPCDGLREPITLGIDDRYHDVYVCDGHHRAVALMQLGVREFPFRWYWIKWAGVRMEHERFPYDLLEGAR